MHVTNRVSSLELLYFLSHRSHQVMVMTLAGCGWQVYVDHGYRPHAVVDLLDSHTYYYYWPYF